jgi:hypothetical protein
VPPPVARRSLADGRRYAATSAHGIHRWVLAAGIALVAQPTTALASGETYVEAVVDSGGQLRIVTGDRREILPAREPEQEGFDQVAVAPSRRAVGWVGLYTNCCTSYPIPMKLVVRSGGKLRTFTGNGLPIWRWRFGAEGKQVAFEQETVHGGIGVHYEQRDVASGRLIAEYNPGPDAGPGGEPPGWVKELDSTR